MGKSTEATVQWETQGKTIGQLIVELQSFEDQNLEVKISIDGGVSHRPISIVGNAVEDNAKVCSLEFHGQN